MVKKKNIKIALGAQPADTRVAKDPDARKNCKKYCKQILGPLAPPTGRQVFGAPPQGVRPPTMLEAPLPYINLAYISIGRVAQLQYDN